MQATWQSPGAHLGYQNHHALGTLCCVHISVFQVYLLQVAGETVHACDTLAAASSRHAQEAGIHVAMQAPLGIWCRS